MSALQAGVAAAAAGSPACGRAQQLTHDLFTAAFFSALNITTHTSVSHLSLLSAVMSLHVTVSPPLSLCNTQCLTAIVEVSKSQSLAALHHWTAHRQLRPRCRQPRSPDTQKLVTARPDSFPPVSAVHRSLQCGAAPT